MGIGATIGRSGWLMSKVILLVFGVSLLLASGALATTTDLFLQFHGVTGESTEINHVGWSDILTVNWGVSVATSPSGGGGGTGKAVLSDLSWTMVADKSFPSLVDDLLRGTHIPDAHVDFVNTANHKSYFEMDFSDVLLTSLKLTGETGADTMVSGSFAYGKIKMTYTPFDSEGNPLAPISAEYDLSSNLGSVGALAEVFALGMAGPTTTAVPLPPSVLLFGSGLAGLVGLRRKFR